MLRFHLLFFVVFLCSAFVCADYTIDDSNYSILTFSENPSGPVWGPFGSDTGEVLEIRLPNGTMQTIDATQCYDGTYTYAACAASNNCAVRFSFTGSGITIYVLQAGPQGMSASLSINSGTATTATLDAPSPPQYYVPRVILFDVQNIPSGTYTAVMTVLDWNGGFSGMMLDYIDVNQAVVAGPTASSSPTSSPSPSPTPSSDPAQSSSSPSITSPTSAGSQVNSQPTSLTGAQTGSAASSAVVISVLSSYSSGATASSTGLPYPLSRASKKTNVADVAGGAVGGAVGLLILLGLAFCYFRRRRLQHMQALNERPTPLLFPHHDARFIDSDAAILDPFAALPATRHSGTAQDPLQTRTNSEAGSTFNVAARDPVGSSSIMNFPHTRVASSGNISATPPVPEPIGAAAVAPTSPERDILTPTQLHTPVRTSPAAAPVSYPNEKLRGSSSTPTRSPQQGATANQDVAGAHPNAVLTDEQADFVNSLFNNNVPAPVVARVLERMLANPQGANGIGVNDPELRAHVDLGNLFPSSRTPAGGAWLSDNGDGETTVGTAPPSYDYARAQ